MKPLSKSMFHPRRAVGQRFLLENRKLIAQIDRRNAVRASLSLGALTLLGGCDVFEKRAVADRAARRFRLERPRLGLHLPAGSPGADLFGGAGRQATSL